MAHAIRARCADSARIRREIAEQVATVAFANNPDHDRPGAEMLAAEIRRQRMIGALVAERKTNKLTQVAVASRGQHVWSARHREAATRPGLNHHLTELPR